MTSQAALNKEDMAAFQKLTAKTYKKQACWFLNAFWKDLDEKKCERVWTYVQKFVELDLKQKEKGSDLDEFAAHRFLEKFGETLTVKKLRKYLKALDVCVCYMCVLCVRVSL